jgi:hypothetical protein
LIAGSLFIYVVLFRNEGEFALATLLGGVIAIVVLLQRQFFVYHQQVLTESLSFSAIIALFSLALFRSVTVKLICGILICAALVALRDVFILMVVFFVALFGMAAGRDILQRPVQALRSYRALALGAALPIIIFGAVAWTTWVGLKVDQRNIEPLVNVVEMRVLPNAAYRQYFANLGMPVDARVMRRVGQPAWYAGDSNGWKGLPEFRDWISAKGQSVYQGFMLRHLNYVVQSFTQWIDPNTIHYTDMSIPALLNLSFAMVMRSRDFGIRQRLPSCLDCQSPFPFSCSCICMRVRDTHRLCSRTARRISRTF